MINDKINVIETFLDRVKQDDLINSIRTQDLLPVLDNICMVLKDLNNVKPVHVPPPTFGPLPTAWPTSFDDVPKPKAKTKKKAKKSSAKKKPNKTN